jgi:hypothetical protein
MAEPKVLRRDWYGKNGPWSEVHPGMTLTQLWELGFLPGKVWGKTKPKPNRERLVWDQPVDLDFLKAHRRAWLGGVVRYNARGHRVSFDGVITTPRQCMTCGKDFLSVGKMHRMCDRCRMHAQDVSPYAADCC